jgi:hypothetical protein
MNSRLVSVLAFLPVTTQLNLRSDGADVDAVGTEDDPAYDFGGFDEFLKQAKEEQEERQQQLLGLGRKIAEASDETSSGDWRAPLAPGASYPGSDAWPVTSTQQCTASDMQTLNMLAYKEAKKKMPIGTRTANLVPARTGACYTAASPDSGTWTMDGSTGFVPCFQQVYPVSTNCATCIGKVYNMAKHNLSTKCYNLCKGRPSRRDGAHWCWEDCQSCMWYVGKKLTECYGEPYDMSCKYAKELLREGYFEKNGIDPFKR